MALESNWNTGGSKQTPSGGKAKSLRDLLHALTGVTIAQLKALLPAQRYAGMIANVGGYLWTWDADSALTGDDQLVITPDDAPSAGRWLLMPGQTVELKLPFTFETADTAALYTVPTGAAIKLQDAWWEVTTSFTGGSSSAIGVSSDATALSTQGDILGGATGDVEAGLVAGEFLGTTGAVDLATNPVAGLVATEIVRFDRITSAFTAGVGVVHLTVVVTKNAGA